MVAHMQLLVIRHALPLRSEPGEGADPELSEIGIEQASRLPDALARFPVTRIVSSPQRRAMQTAQPVADKLGLTVDIDTRLAEYDYELSHYTPIEEASEDDVKRLIAGHLPGSVDEDAFIARVNAGVADIVENAGHDETVALFCHGGVINALLHTIMGTGRLLCAQVDYAGVTRLLSSRTGKLGVAAVNGTEHVWDLLPRNQRW